MTTKVMDASCLGNEEGAFQESNGQWKVDKNNWIAVCQCPQCFDIQREEYLNNLKGMSAPAKNLIMNL